MNQNKKIKKNLSDSIDLIPMINLIFLLLIFFMLTGVIKKKELIDIERPQSKSGVVNKLNKEETVIVLNENGEIFLNNVYYEIDELINNIDPSVGKVTIDIDKKAKISKFNQLLETVGSLNKKEVYIKVIEKKNVVK